MSAPSSSARRAVCGVIRVDAEARAQHVAAVAFDELRERGLESRPLLIGRRAASRPGASTPLRGRRSAAPALASSATRRSTAAKSASSPPSENESGVRFTMPIHSGRCLAPARASSSTVREPRPGIVSRGASAASGVSTNARSVSAGCGTRKRSVAIVSSPYSRMSRSIGRGAQRPRSVAAELALDLLEAGRASRRVRRRCGSGDDVQERLIPVGRRVVGQQGRRLDDRRHAHEIHAVLGERAQALARDCRGGSPRFDPRPR